MRAASAGMWKGHKRKCPGAPATVRGMNGTSATTGQRLAGIEHLRQSIRDILTTPIGSRVMRRDYGSRLFQLVDSPMNRATLVQIYAATIEALARWEARIRVERVVAAAAQPGRVSLDIHGVYVPDGRAVVLVDIEVRP